MNEKKEILQKLDQILDNLQKLSIQSTAENLIGMLSSLQELSKVRNIIASMNFEQEENQNGENCESEEN